MKKVIKLTESDLTRIVKRVIQEVNDEFDDDSVIDNNFNQEEYDELLDQAREFLCREIGLEEDEVYNMSDDQIIGEIKYYDKGLYRRLEELKYSKPVDLDEPYDSIGGYSVNDLRRAFKNYKYDKK
jgi:hypothetical protein